MSGTGEQAAAIPVMTLHQSTPPMAYTGLPSLDTSYTSSHQSELDSTDEEDIDEMHQRLTSTLDPSYDEMGNIVYYRDQQSSSLSPSAPSSPSTTTSPSASTMSIKRKPPPPISTSSSANATEDARPVSGLAKSVKGRRLKEETGSSTKSRKELAPIKIRQKRHQAPWHNLPPTPKTAFFDTCAEPDELPSLAAPRVASTSNSSSTTLKRNSDLISPASPSSHRESQPEVSPPFSSDGFPPDESFADNSAGYLSLSSEVDTPGPLTPATPAWKPRELTLLQRKAESLAADSNNSRDNQSSLKPSSDRGRSMIGLGVHVASPLLSDPSQFCHHRASRTIAKDILPVSTSTSATSFSSSSSPQHSSSNRARELKLLASTAPGKSTRSISLGRGHPTASVKPINSTTSSLPVLPPGPAFQASSPLLSASAPVKTSPASASEAKASSAHQRTSSDGSNGSDSFPQSLQSFPQVPVRDEGKVTQPITGASATSPAMTASKRKVPPASLNFVSSSPASSYSHHSPSASADVSQRNSLLTPHTNNITEDVFAAYLGVPSQQTAVSDKQSQPRTPITPSQAYHTPLQSPVGKLKTEEKTERSALEAVVDHEEKRSDARSSMSTTQERSLSVGTSQAVDHATLSSSPRCSTDAFQYEAPSSTSHMSTSAQDHSSVQSPATTKTKAPDLTTSKSDSSINFDTSIFRSPPRAHALILEEEEREALSPTTDAKATFGTFASPSSTRPAQDSPRNSASLSEVRGGNSAQQSLPTALPSAQARRDRNLSEPPLPARSVSLPQSAAPTQTKRKQSLVPEVPHFGYYRPSPVTTASNSAAASPMLDLHDPHFDMLDMGQQCSSRWSSGSDSDDDRPLSKSASRKSSKQRKSVGSVSVQSARKDSLQGGVTGATGPVKKPGFFSGLTLRKKSIPNLSHWSTSTQSTSLFTSSSNSNSPAPGRGMGLDEFPFPSPSPNTSQRQSFSSNAVLASPSLNMHANDGFFSAARSRSTSHSKAQQPMPSPSLPAIGSFSRKLKPRPSDASIRTTASQQQQQQHKRHSGSRMSGRFSTTSASPAGHSPVMERKVMTTGEEVPSMPGLGIQVPSSSDDIPQDDKSLKESYAALRRSLRAANSSDSMKLPKGTSRRSIRDSQDVGMPNNIHMRAVTEDLSTRYDETRDKEIEASPLMASRRISKGGIGKAGSRASLRSSSDSATLLGRLGLTSPTMSNFMLIASPDETPRLPYFSLPKTETAANIPANDARSQSSQGMIKGLDSAASPSKARTKRLRISAAEERPRYPSLTDIGREYVKQNPSAAMGGAHGLPTLMQLFDCDVDVTQYSGGGGRATKPTAYSDTSSSGTDDYGSSDGAGRQDGSAGRRSGGGGGAGEGGRNHNDNGSGDKRDGDEDRDRRSRLPAERCNEEETSSSSSDSEDSYGASDVDTSFVQSSNTLGKISSALSSSSSSDDVPLGQRMENPKGVQKQLQRMQTRISRRRGGKEGGLAAREVPASELDAALDVSDLTLRLLKVQQSREAGTSARSAETSAPPPPSAQALAVSRSQSLSSKKAIPRQVAPPLPSSTMLVEKSSTRGNMSSDQPLGRAEAPQRIRTTDLSKGQATVSSPLSVSSSSIDYPRQSQPRSSSGGGKYSDSSDATMVTAKEAQPSSQADRSSYRSGVVADFANTIRARSRTRSFAQPFNAAPSVSKTARPPLPTTRVAVPASSRMPTSQQHSSPTSAGAQEADTSDVMRRSVSAEEETAAERTNVSSRSKPLPVLVEHRIYLLNQQRSTTVEVTMNARARDIVLQIMEKEPMPADSNIGGWTLYDVSCDLAIERPVREYEILTDIVANRANVKLDYFLLKRTELAPYLSLKNVPKSSAALAGWLHVQDNLRKKWNKRWVELRENGIYQAKNEKGKEESLLCALSSFDLYLTHAANIKTPKQHSFAMRSQNSITLFESPEADYVHYFCLNDGNAARHWITAIINARTFVLRQQKSHLFRMPAAAASGTQPTGHLDSVDTVLQSTPTINNTTTSQRRHKSPPADSAAASMSASAAPSITTSPLLTFPQQSFPKGSLMQERFEKQAESAPGTATLRGKESTADRMRREELQTAERKTRKEGKPLIDVIADVRGGPPVATSANPAHYIGRQ